MGKFNETTRATTRRPNTKNVAGGAAFKRDDFRTEVASTVLNTMVNGDSYYEKEADRLARIESMILDNPEYAEFLAKAMVYTRNEGNLRSISHYMAVVLAESAKGTSFLKPAFIKTLIRPDDATEMIALWNTRNIGKMIPNSLRRAVKNRLENKWDAYQLKKYFGNGAVKVSNLVNIAHPTPSTDEQRTVFKQALEGNLPNIATVQTVNASSTGEERAENYANMLKERKLGYMGALKNIKNILEAGADSETIDLLCELLVNENAVLKSRVLPFRFTQAYAMVDAMNMDKIKAKKVLKAIEQGFIISARNVPIVEDGESIAILLDESGSMGGGYWHSEELMDGNSPFNVGKTLMASMLTGLDKDKTLGYLWADNAREVSIDGSPMNFIKKTRTQGGGTNLTQAIGQLISTKTFVDKLVIFTDMQQNSFGRWGGEMSFGDMIAKYRKINPDVKVLFWNLEGYGGGTPMKLDHDILEVSGFSNSMLSVIPKMWKSKDALIAEIEAIKL